MDNGSIDQPMQSQEEMDMQDKEDAERAHQEGMDEQAEMLSKEDMKELALWRIENAMTQASTICDKEDIGCTILDHFMALYDERP